MLTRLSRSPLIRRHARFQSTLVTTSALQSKEQFETEIAENKILNLLWKAPHTPITPEDDVINATSTLPIVLRSKDAVFRDVVEENPDMTGMTLKLKQFTTYFKSVIHFYRVGIQNVWNNRKVSNQIKWKYYVETVGKGGEVFRRNISNGKDLTSVLSALESLERIEQEALKKIDRTTVLSITRREYQTVLRTGRDFYKIPTFALILVVFAETTPILCTLIPEITPSTCVFPGLVKKMNKQATKAQADLTKLRLEKYSTEYAKGSYPVQTVSKIPVDELRLLAKSLNLTSRYIPVGLYPISILQQRLLQRYNEVKVDNYFLIYGTQNLWHLNKNELIRCCVDRGLIDFNVDDLSKIGSHELQMRLFFFLGLMEGDKAVGNVGIFGLNHLALDNSPHFQNIDQKTAHNLHSWLFSH